MPFVTNVQVWAGWRIGRVAIIHLRFWRKFKAIRPSPLLSSAKSLQYSACNKCAMDLNEFDVYSCHKIAMISTWSHTFMYTIEFLSVPMMSHPCSAHTKSVIAFVSKGNLRNLPQTKIWHISWPMTHTHIQAQRHRESNKEFLCISHSDMEKNAIANPFNGSTEYSWNTPSNVKALEVREAKAPKHKNCHATQTNGTCNVKMEEKNREWARDKEGRGQKWKENGKEK